MVQKADEYGKISLKDDEPLVRKFSAVSKLTDGDFEILESAHEQHSHRDTDIYCGGDQLNEILLLRSGWAFRYRLLDDGRRQIVHLLVPGDLIGPFAPTARQFAATLTSSAICRLPRRDVAAKRERGACPGFAAAVDALIAEEYEHLAERLVSLGRRNAKEGMAHLLLELRARLACVGLVSDNSFELPLTQEVMGDALGLSIVHVNRTLRVLREERLATVGFGRATLHDVDGLALVADSETGEPAPATSRAPAGTARAMASPLH